MRESISSIFAAMRTRSVSDGGRAPARGAHVLLDLGQREADRLRPLDRAQEPDGLLVVAPVTLGVRSGSGSRPRRS